MFRQNLSLKQLLLGSIALTLAACNPSATPTDAGGTDTGPIADTGPTPDTGHDSGAAMSVCASAMAVTLPMGAHSVMGDTTGHATGVLDLGTACGGMGMAAAGTTAPQQVLALTLPGAHTDTVAVNYTLANMGTNAMFDTTTQVRMNCMDATGELGSST